MATKTTKASTGVKAAAPKKAAPAPAAKAAAKPAKKAAAHSTAEVARELVAMLRAGKFEEVGETFWAEDVVSVEAMGGPMQVCKGIEAVRGKSRWWYDNHIVHAFSATDPLVNGDQFVVQFAMDVTMKADNRRIKMDEIALYTVRDGKIAEERFFYPTTPA